VVSGTAPDDLRWDDVVVAAGNGAAQPEVRVRAWYSKDGDPLPYFDVFVGGWMLKDGRYATRERAMLRAEREVEIARTQRKGHFGW
jgi:hypothetical protein